MRNRSRGKTLLAARMEASRGQLFLDSDKLAAIDQPRRHVRFRRHGELHRGKTVGGRDHLVLLQRIDRFEQVRAEVLKIAAANVDVANSGVG